MHPGIPKVFCCGAMELWCILHPPAVFHCSVWSCRTASPHPTAAVTLPKQWMATHKVTTQSNSPDLCPRLIHPWGGGLSEQHGLSTTHALSRHLEQAAQVGNTSSAREGARCGCEVVAGGKSQLSSPPASTGSQPRPWASLYPGSTETELRLQGHTQTQSSANRPQKSSLRICQGSEMRIFGEGGLQQLSPPLHSSNPPG